MLLNTWSILCAALDILQKLFTILGILFGISTFRQYRQQKRSEASALVYGYIEESVKDILEIKNTPDKFQSTHIDDQFMVELKPPSVEKEHMFAGKPSRMINNIVRRLKKDVYPLIAQIAGNEGNRIKAIVEEIDTTSKILGSAIHLELEKHTEPINLDTINQTINHSETKLKHLLADAGKILKPVVEQKSIVIAAQEWLLKKLGL